MTDRGLRGGGSEEALLAHAGLASYGAWPVVLKNKHSTNTICYRLVVRQNCGAEHARALPRVLQRETPWTPVVRELWKLLS